MKFPLICAIAFVAGTAHSQSSENHFAFSISSGVYPLTRLSSYPVARFQYRYAGGDPIDYVDSLRNRPYQSRGGVNISLEFANREGWFYGAGVGELLAMNSREVSTLFIRGNIGYNFDTGISGLIIQPSMGFAQTIIQSHLKSIPQNESDIWVFNKTIRYEDKCNCPPSTTTHVIVLNRTTFGQARLALKYNVNRFISMSIAATYYVPLQTSLSLDLSNKFLDVRHKGYVIASPVGATDDSKRYSRASIYGEATITFNMIFKKKGQFRH